jgi:hypothetical protein
MKVKDFHLCVAGDSSLHRHFKTALVEKEIQGKPIVLSVISSPKELFVERSRACDMLYIGDKAGDVTPFIQAVEGKPVLTIGTASDFLERGGMVHLFSESNRIKFSLSAKAADRAGLRPGYRLLELAVAVE